MSKDKVSTIKEVPEVEKAPKKQTVNIMFRQNRKYDLHVGRDMVTFRGRELKKIPKAWLKHPDFKQVSNMFIVKGV